MTDLTKLKSGFYRTKGEELIYIRRWTSSIILLKNPPYYVATQLAAFDLTDLKPVDPTEFLEAKQRQYNQLARFISDMQRELIKEEHLRAKGSKLAYLCAQTTP